MRVSAERDHADYKVDFPDYNVSLNGELLSGGVLLSGLPRSMVWLRGWGNEH